MLYWCRSANENFQKLGNYVMQHQVNVYRLAQSKRGAPCFYAWCITHGFHVLTSIRYGAWHAQKYKYRIVTFASPLQME